MTEKGPTKGVGLAALRELNRYIQSKTEDAHAPALGEESRSASELKSVHQFRQAWAKISTQEHVEQAIAQGPENAGPLNSHRLVLRTLALMRDLSPSYLQRFKAHMDTMLSLDQLDLQAAAVAPAAARRHRQKKGAAG